MPLFWVKGRPLDAYRSGRDDATVVVANDTSEAEKLGAERLGEDLSEDDRNVLVICSVERLLIESWSLDAEGAKKRVTDTPPDAPRCWFLVVVESGGEEDPARRVMVKASDFEEAAQLGTCLVADRESDELPNSWVATSVILMEHNLRAVERVEVERCIALLAAKKKRGA